MSILTNDLSLINVSTYYQMVAMWMIVAEPSPWTSGVVANA
jgi:hypothetical protein